MTQTTWIGSDKASTVMLNGIPDNDTDLYATKTEVEAARDGEASLLAKQDAQDTLIAALGGSPIAIETLDQATLKSYFLL